MLRLVQDERKVLTRLGTRKLHHLISPLLAQSGIRFGRDRLFSLLGEHDLLIRPLRRYVTTTNSKHFLRMHPNRTTGLKLTRPEQLWVSDITYIRTEEGFCYLNLVTDAFSRKIMGYAIAPGMDAQSMKQAYQMALNNRIHAHAPLIHHSDRGLQYCSADYVNLSAQHGVQVSMTQNGDPYENALAERMNRTMKEEFGLGSKLKSYEHGALLSAQGIHLYNTRRPHLSLGMKTPEQVHNQSLNLALSQQADPGAAGEQPGRNTATNENGAGADMDMTAPANHQNAIFVAMPEKTHTAIKTKIPATEAAGILS